MSPPGGNCVFFITDKDKLRGGGANGYGQLGFINDESEHQYDPKLIEGLPDDLMNLLTSM